MKKLIFIDLDDTLIKTATGEKFPVDCTDFRIQKNVLDKIVEEFPDTICICIVTNQGGIGKFITKEDFEAKLESIKTFIIGYLDKKLKTDYYVYANYCTSIDKDDPFRKPNTGMLECMYNYWENIHRYDPITKSECIMIGDASGKEGDYSDSDKKCAENFGIDYIDVRDFLNGGK